VAVGGEFVDQFQVVAYDGFEVIDGGIDSLDACGLFAGADGDIFDIFDQFGEGSDDGIEEFCSFIDQHHSFFSGFDIFRDDIGDGFGGVCGFLGQVADFGSDNGEASACVPGACGFYGGVEGQQVGLKADIVDDADDIADFIPGSIDGFHGFGDISN